ncbi:MAG: hypothetical protein FJ086_17775 [Deltaproteobacteria bacterium]|nr:hypothetical protein [Deltaproteobacteria bacterium]
MDTAALASDRYGVAWASFPSSGGAPAGTWQLVLKSHGVPVASTAYPVEQAATVRMNVPAEAQPGEALLLDARLGWLATAALLEESTVQLEVKDPSLAPVGAFTSPVLRLPAGMRRVNWGARPGFAFPVFGRHTAQAR